MAATLRQLARPTLRALSKHLASPTLGSHLHRRDRNPFLPAAAHATFFSLPKNPLSPQSPSQLTACRRLPYPAATLYDIIADVDSYSSFLPYCTHSRVTLWRPGPDGKQRWPAAGELTVGWGPITETYTSRLYCIPGRVVEAVSGKGSPGISLAEARECGIDLGEVPLGFRASTGGLFESLVTRWTVTQDEGNGGSMAWTDVELSIRYQFVNPMYQVATASVVDEVAGVMVNAFEKRAKDLLGPA